MIKVLVHDSALPEAWRDPSVTADSCASAGTSKFLPELASQELLLRHARQARQSSFSFLVTLEQCLLPGSLHCRLRSPRRARSTFDVLVSPALTTA
jgi:hypothetical protein